MLYFLCRYDPDEVARVVPPELKPSGTGWGVMAMYTVSSGWGIAPYSGFFMAVEIEGFDSNDGSPGLYMHSGLYSGLGGEVMRTLYNSNFEIGWTRRRQEGSKVVCEAGAGEQTLARMTAEMTDQRKPMTGISRFIGRRPGGGFNSYSVAWSSDVDDVSPLSVEFFEGGAGLIHPLQPLEMNLWPVSIRDMAMAFTPPRPIGDAAELLQSDAHNLALVELFSRLGRAAAIIDRNGTAITLNTASEALVADGTILVRDGRLQPRRQRDATAFAAILASAGLGPDAVSERVILHRADAGPPVIAQVLALSPVVAGADKLVVFFDDPAGAISSDPGPGLQLLGLTPAEARIAGLVGAGRSPREAADELELTLNTVRSALKIAFDKLSIRRQSELAKIVARLES